MAIHYATPDGRSRRRRGEKVGAHLQDAIDAAEPGDTVELLPGIYTEPVTILNKHAPATSPIRIKSDGCATLDGQRNVLRPPFIDHLDEETYAFIKICKSSGITIDNATIQNAWPTAIYLDNAQDITIRRLNLNGATYGIFARGATTRGITIERCSWIQDTRIWDEVLWSDIHDPPSPRRELDGDFFRSIDIAGDVIVRNNFIAQAFNGVHLFASEDAAEKAIENDGGVNENVWVYRNTFAFIRDSTVEAEFYAKNWWVFENKIFNCHTWFAFEKCAGGYWYLFANRGWFDRKPGPPGDCHVGGAVIKTNAVSEKNIDRLLPRHPHYVFNNSWYLRSPVLKKGKLRHFRHFNNAIDYALPGHHAIGAVDEGRRMIGVGTPDPRCEGGVEPEEPFTKQWRRFDIQFGLDVCNHPDYPAGLRMTGYPVDGIQAGPGFVAAREGNFRLAPSSPCLLQAQPADIQLPGGRIWKLPEGLNVGAMHRVDDAKDRDKHLPYAPGDLQCPLNVLPADYKHEPEE